MTVFSETLQSLRKEKKLTQNGLAEQLGVSPQAVSKWENGSYPDADFIPHIADFFEVSIDQLYGREKKKLSMEEEIYESISKEFGWNDKEKQKVYFDRVLEFFWASFNGCFTWKTEYQKKPVREDTACGSVLITTEGLVFQSNRKICECGFVLKRPPEGFGTLFSEKERLAGLFYFLSDQNNLKILEFMFSLREAEAVKSSVVAAKLGLEKEAVEKSLDILISYSQWAGAFDCIRIMDDGEKSEKAYTINLGNASNFLFLLAMAQFINHPTTSFEPLTIQMDSKKEALVNLVQR